MQASSYNPSVAGIALLHIERMGGATVASRPKFHLATWGGRTRRLEIDPETIQRWIAVGDVNLELGSRNERLIAGMGSRAKIHPKGRKAL
jgi:hypothetical protein